MLRDSTASPRIFELALLGEFSPVRMANEIQRAFAAGRRTATATGFQLVELVRLIENLTPRSADSRTKRAPFWFDEIRERSLNQVFRIVRTAADRADFRESCTADPFGALVTAVMSPKTASRLREAIQLGKEER
jgi:hypothetical protein